MNDIEITYEVNGKFTELQKEVLCTLQEECFGDVDEKSIEEDFIVVEYGRLFAYLDKKIVGTVGLFKREISFEGEKVTVGGLGGVCVTCSMRKRGIATQLLKEGLKLLNKEKCDVACLNVDLEKKVYTLYEKLGFTMMERNISFENSKGDIKFDQGTMFIPVCSQEIYESIMNSKTTFHYGKGYW